MHHKLSTWIYSTCILAGINGEPKTVSSRSVFKWMYTYVYPVYTCTTNIIHICIGTNIYRS